MVKSTNFKVYSDAIFRKNHKQFHAPKIIDSKSVVHAFDDNS